MSLFESYTNRITTSEYSYWNMSEESEAYLYIFFILENLHLCLGTIRVKFTTNLTNIIIDPQSFFSAPWPVHVTPAA